MKWKEDLFKKTKPSYATGFVRPKTTSLFFDKICLTDDEANRNEVPFSIRLSLGTYDEEFNRLYGKAVLCNIDPRCGQKAYFKSALYNNSISIDHETEELIEKLKFTAHIQTMCYSKFPTEGIVSKLLHESIYTLEESYIRDLYDQLSNSYLMKNDEYYTSYNRNEAIRLIVSRGRSQGIELVPIFFDLTDFEKSLLMLGPLDDSDKKNPAFINAFDKIPKRDVNAIEATIKSIPIIVEDSLSWDQVKEMRRDKKAIRSLKRFRTWASQELKDKSQDEITEILGQELDDYRYALKKHGVLTTVGGFTTVLSMASTIAGAVEGSQLQLAAAGFSITAGIVTFSAQQLYEYFDTRRQPIAYIYNIINK